MSMPRPVGSDGQRKAAAEARRESCISEARDLVNEPSGVFTGFRPSLHRKRGVGGKTLPRTTSEAEKTRLFGRISHPRFEVLGNGGAMKRISPRRESAALDVTGGATTGTCLLPGGRGRP
ncbi:hypothetical protein DFH09DRAFT_1092485 [Mycena vulgaris]|nr:hypothetical protein DFH09DRAFT_1092485 [Mycena vulgaris]